MFRTIVLACALALALSAAACSEETPQTTAASASDTAAAPAADFPRDVLGVAIESRPERIVSASASHTEMLYAMGAGDRVIATDAFSNYPEAAAETEKIDAFNIGVEVVAALDPDLVILAFDPGDVASGLAGLGIPTLLFDPPATLEEAYDQVSSVGEATGADAAAAGLVAGMEAEIAELVSRVPEDGEPLTYYHELDPMLFSIGSETFAGGLYELAGLRNVADDSADAGNPYPQLSAEFLIGADPDFIFLADTRCCGESVATVAERPGWDDMTAVSAGRVVELDDDVASRWGPRIVDFLEAIVTAAYGPAGD